MVDKIYLEEAIQDLHNIQDLVRWSVSRFNDAGLYYGHGTDNPWDEARALVLQLLHLGPEDSALVLQSRLTRSEKQLIVDAVVRRVTERVPVAYLTNQAWFCQYPFYVDERVLVPRSPFAELINKQFEPYISQSPDHVLDMCTGSACIAIACAHSWPEAQVDAVDISDDALAVAEINIDEHQLSHRVFPLKSDLFSQLAGQKYDLIVSNPPYVDEEDMSDLPEEFHHEPELGLAAGFDGLYFLHKILQQAPEHLTDNGWLFVEVGNSLVHIEEQYPGLALEWVEFESGGIGVFAISRANLVQYQQQQESD